MIDRLPQGGAGDQIAALNDQAAEDRRLSSADGNNMFLAGLDNGRSLVVHHRGGEKVGIKLSDTDRFIAGSKDVVYMLDGQGVYTTRFTMGEPPEEFSPVAPEEVQRIAHEGRDFELFQGDKAWI